MDIDPGLLQYWMSRGLISPAAHDLYFTTGETVGSRSKLIPECGLDWLQIRPPISLDLWPYSPDPGAEAFTTVSSWWSERDYVGDSNGYYDNTKRTAFLDFIDLPDIPTSHSSSRSSWRSPMRRSAGRSRTTAGGFVTRPTSPAAPRAIGSTFSSHVASSVGPRRLA